ncbi:MAG: hypothetical protein AAFZ65_19185, partial [Planctomycetota bacterium]
GVWRCLTHFGLVGQPRRFEDLLARVDTARLLPLPGGTGFEGSGFEGSGFDGFGLGPDERVRILLHGRNVTKEGFDGDVLFELDLGRSLERGGAFARIEGRDAPVLLEDNLAAGLRRDLSLAQALTGIPTPPLADPHVIPAAWPPLASGIESVRVQRDDGTAFTLTLDGSPRADLPAGVVGYQVTDEAEGLTERAHPALSTGYTRFLELAPFLRPRDPRSVDSSTPVEAQVTVLGRQGDPLSLRILASGLGRDKLVVVDWSSSVFEITDEVAALLAPDFAQLVDPNLGIAWDPYLRPGR